MKVIETNYLNHRFRSRTEARWAVFLYTANISFEYEKEGFDLGGIRYLPDFFLPDLNIWLEVKGKPPTPHETMLCERLANTTNTDVMLAVGAPKQEEQVHWFEANPSPDDPRGGELYYFADDRRNENEFWLISDGCSTFSLGPGLGPDHGRYPGVYSATKKAYQAAQSARFEHGENGKH